MSAQQGRQSPPPEHQSKAQVGSVAEQPNVGAAPSAEHAQQKSNEQKDQLPSNPSHPLADAAKDKVSKTTDPKS